MGADRFFLLQHSIFVPRGASAAPLSVLGIILTAIALVVTVLMVVLLIVALRRKAAQPEPGSVPLAALQTWDGRSRRWIVIGTLVSGVILLYTGIHSTFVMMAFARDGRATTMTIRVSGHQYWWEVRYPASGNEPEIVDANEIHIPVHTRVRLELLGGDVIHSLWIPALGGKTDLIPGRENSTWLTADAPGVYVGQCAEYCGISHANMRLRVIAHTAEDFADWRRRQAITPVADSAALRIMQAHGCSACHRVGPYLEGTGGPDLTHVAGRATLAAGTLDSTASTLRAWLLHPTALKPGARMPDTDLSPDEIVRLTTFLRTLR